MTRVASVLGAGFLLAGLVAATPSFAHPILLASSPEAGAVVAKPPTRVVLRFNNRIEKALCRIALVDASGRTTPLAVAEGQGGEAELVAPLPAIPPGTYRVDWRVMSADGHFVSGSFSFQLAR